MIIRSIQPQSLIDYPGRISSIVFTQGCNLKCWYCHNKELLPLKKKVMMDTEKAIGYLKGRQKLINSVVISGGEPTIQDGLLEFIQRLVGFNIKLDTNGTNPKVLYDLLSNNTLDYVAMDMKTSPNKLGQFGIDKATIDQSLLHLKTFSVNYELRTTVYPNMTEEDISDIRDYIGYDTTLCLQQYRPCVEGDPDPLDPQFIVDMANKYECNVRGV